MMEITELKRDIERIERKVDGLHRLRQDELSGPRLRYSKAKAAYLLDCSPRHLDKLEAEYGLQGHQETGKGGKRYYLHADLVEHVEGGFRATELKGGLNGGVG